MRDFLFLSEHPDLLGTALADGTNVPEGTKFHSSFAAEGVWIALAAHAASRSWRSRAKRLLAEFLRLRRSALPVQVMLEQFRIPSVGSNGHCSDFINYRKICSGPGVWCELSFLEDNKTNHAFPGMFAFLDVNSQAARGPDGQPLAMRLGFRRHFCFLEGPRAAADRRKLLTTRLIELCEEGGEFLLQLPPAAISRVWTAWGELVVLPKSPQYRWCDAVFEFAWQGSGDSRPSRQVFDHSGYSSLVLHGHGLFPRIPPFEINGQLIAHQYPSEGGHPFLWSSSIKDIVAQSINLIEFLLAHDWPTEASPPATKPGRPKPASTKGLAVGKAPESGGSKKLGVSYAWGDKTSNAGRERERLVDECCKKCQQWGYQIIRDKRQLRYGDVLSQFIQRMTRTSRVMVIFSAKYLKSRACMLELHAIYRRAQSEPKTFQKRVIPLVLGDANIDSPTERAAHARYWKAQLKELEAEVDHLGGRDLEYLEQLRTLVTEISKMLSFVSEIWSPRGFREIRRNGYEALREMLKGD